MYKNPGALNQTNEVELYAEYKGKWESTGVGKGGDGTEQTNKKTGTTS
jgi:hypothetical protein